MHTCDLLVICCIDFRFQEALRNFLNEKHRGDYDLVCLAGAAKNLVSGSDRSQAVLFDQIEISKKLHRIKKILLINHQNCGAYGKSLTSGSSQEKKVHKADLSKAREKIITLFPKLEVFLYFIEFTEESAAGIHFTKLD